MNRALGNGRLLRQRRASGELVWCGAWTDGNRRRHRRYLSEDKRIAQRALAKIIRDRDLHVHGLFSDDAQEMRLSDLAQRHLAELRASRSAGHCEGVLRHLNLMIARLGDRRVRDILPVEVL